MVKYQGILTARKYQSDDQEVVFLSPYYRDSYDEAEDDALNARAHPKEKVIVKEIML